MIQPHSRKTGTREYRSPLEVRDGSLQSLNLDWNEPSRAHSGITDTELSTLLSRYPDPEATELKEALSSYNSIPTDQITITCGADDALRIICDTFLSQNSEVIYPVPGYDKFRELAAIRGANLIPVTTPITTELEGTFSVTPDLIYLINPNNPLGYRIPLDQIEETLRSFPDTPVVIDESYIEFLGLDQSAARLVSRYDNLIVVRTFSKAFQLPGIRVGYIISNPETINSLDKNRDSKSVTAFSQTIALEALSELSATVSYIAEINRGKAIFTQLMSDIRIRAYGEYGNFLILELPNPKHAAIKLREEGLFLRYLHYPETNTELLRITVGTEEEMRKAAKIIGETLDN